MPRTSTAVTYTNSSGGIPGRLTLLASTSLHVTNGTVNCPLGTGDARLTHQTLTLMSRARRPSAT
jgi:hypothetical protein